MKKLTALISALALLLLLGACSSPGAENTGNTGTSPEPAVSDEPVLDTAEPSVPVGGTETPEPNGGLSTDEMVNIATELSERRAPVSELYEAIGQPLSTDYAPGCVEPDSEDGELMYSGFVVYTVRTADREYVYDVLLVQVES